MIGKIRFLLGCAAVAASLALVAPTASSTALSISESPLFLTIALPPNIVVLLDDSGSMAWGYAPDSMGGNAAARVQIRATNLPATLTVPTTTVISTPGIFSTVNVANPPHSVIVATGTPNFGTVKVTGHYNYGCSSPYTLVGPSSGSTNTPGTNNPPTTCQQQTYNYSCPTGYNLSPASPTSGTSSTASGYTCTNLTYTYSCSSGFTLTPATPNTGSSSTPPSGTTCQKAGYTYSCPTGFTLSGSSTGTTATPPSGVSCNATAAYVCPTGMTLSGSGSSSVCNGTGYQSFNSVSTPDTFHYKSSAFNPLYYNPNIIYTAPYKADGTQYTTSFTTAYYDGFDSANGSVNLSTSYKATETYTPGSTTGDSANNGCNYFNSSGSCNSDIAQAAFYYNYTPTSTTAVANGCTSVKTDDGCYTPVAVSSTSGPGGTDERQNFANWYSFYRTRHFAVVSSADIAFNTVSQTYRVAWLNLHTCAAFSSTTCKGWPSSGTYDNRINVFTGQHRTDFYNWLSRFPANNGTNLRQALDVVGEYYKTSGVDSPYAFSPHQTDSPEYVCRPNYAIALTDGLWNEATSSMAVQPGNADSTAVTLPDNTPYPATNYPYSDVTPINVGTSGSPVYNGTNTLADVAFHYWATNLRPDLGISPTLQYMPFNKNVAIKDSSGTIANVIPYWNAQNDPASWPHMVTFTVGLGLSSVLASAPSWNGNTFSGGYNDLVTGKTAWPSSFSCGDISGSCTDPVGNVYDLWHAAINGRGEFFAADTPQEVTLAFNSLITRIQGRVGSSSAIAVNSTKLDSNTLIYQAQFNSSDWSGEVLAFSISTKDGSISSTPAWRASTLIPAPASRNILTWNDTTQAGASFLWTNLSTAEKTALNNNIFGLADGNGSLRLDYLRGDQSQEQSNGGAFRTRSQILGDIVNSNPFYVGNQDFGFSTNTTAIPEGASYETFVATKPSRIPVLYVGSNDGMLHGFNANTGVEIFDYVPRAIYSNLSALTDPTYVHQYYVDGSSESVDAYFGSTPAWHSLVASTTGAGGRGAFLLDVTAPTSMTATNVVFDYDGATSVSGGDNNMGYTIGQPSIARMQDGNWYMIWGNGYNSPNQHAVLYMYNINSGSMLTFDTKAGSATTPNGMSTPAPIDYDGDRVADAIYAGDLLGNLWKIDVSSSNPSQWGFSFKSGNTPKPLFTATDASGNVQPITDRPQVGINTNGAVEVYFGTGTYFETGDNTVGSTPPVQSFYGLIDDKANQVTRTNLLQQSIVAQTTVNGTNFRVSTGYALTSSQQGWYMDLNFPTAQGERVVSNAVIDNGRIIFTTLIPQGNACQFGGVSFLMELDGTAGAALTVSPFDVNGDGKINNNDFVTVTYTDPKTGHPVTATVPVSGKQSNVGIIQTPGIISAGELQYKYYSGSTGNIGMTVESTASGGGRLSWQQLQ